MGAWELSAHLQEPSPWNNLCVSCPDFASPSRFYVLVLIVRYTAPIVDGGDTSVYSGEASRMFIRSLMHAHPCLRLLAALMSHVSLPTHQGVRRCCLFEQA